MSKKRRSREGVPWPDGDPFPNWWAEIKKSPTKRFKTCTAGEFFENRLYVWKISSKYLGVMRLYFPNGKVLEIALKRDTDTPNTVKSILNEDHRTKIIIVDHHQILNIHVEPGDDEKKLVKV